MRKGVLSRPNPDGPLPADERSFAWLPWLLGLAGLGVLALILWLLS